MEEANMFCELLFLWLEEQEQCTEKLLALAQKLESCQCISNKVQKIGNTTAVASYTTALFATALTGGLAIPLIAAGAGIAVSLTSKVKESDLLKKTMSEATDIIKKVEKIEDEIQMKLRILKKKCGRRMMEAHCSTDSFECELNTQIMAALARRDGINVSEDLLRSFNKATRFHQSTLDGDEPLVAPNMVVPNGLLAHSFVVVKNGLNASSKVMVRDNVSIITKTFIKETPQVAGLTSGIYHHIQRFKNVKCNTIEASQSLRIAASETRERARTLKEKLDAQREIIKKLSGLRVLIKDLGEYSFVMDEFGKEVLDYMIATCSDPDVVSRLQKLRYQTQLLNLLRFARDHLLEDLEKETKKRGLKEIHIVFVAHGSITDKFCPASVLVPTDSITDTILYSPWNCAIDSKVAYGIAKGDIKLTDRQFGQIHGRNEIVYHDLPNRWNSMHRSKHNIPYILLGSMDPKEDLAWKAFKEHEFSGGNLYNEDRIIIPFTMPKDDPESDTEVPFFVLIFVTSYILMLTEVKATVHLASCLGNISENKWQEEWSRQYFCTDDDIFMTLNREKRDDLLFRALSEMFDRSLMRHH